MKNDAKQDSCEQITFSDIFSSMNIMTDDTCIDLPLDWGEAFDPASGSQDCQAGEASMPRSPLRRPRLATILRLPSPDTQPSPPRRRLAAAGVQPPGLTGPAAVARAAYPMPSFSALPIWAVWISNTWPTFPEKHRIR